MSTKAQALTAAAKSKRQQAAGLREMVPWISLEVHRDALLDQAKALEAEAERLKLEAGKSTSTLEDD